MHSDADAGLPYVAEADVAVRLPGTSPADTYLRADLLVEAARTAGADAVHPGYGFLSENAAFARAVLDAGLTWVGPSPDAIELMGSKVEAKKRMADAGVPVLTDLDPAAVTADGPAGAGQGVGRWRRPRDAGGPRPRRPPGRGRRGERRGGLGVRRRHRLRRALRRAWPARRGAGRRIPRRRRRLRRPRLLGPAAAPEGRRGGSGAARRRRGPHGAARGRTRAPPRRSTTTVPAPSSSSSTTQATGSTSWR